MNGEPLRENTLPGRVGGEDGARPAGGQTPHGQSGDPGVSVFGVPRMAPHVLDEVTHELADTFTVFCADERCHAFHRVEVGWFPPGPDLPAEVVASLHAGGWRLDDDGQWRCEQHAEDAE